MDIRAGVVVHDDRDEASLVALRDDCLQVGNDGGSLRLFYRVAECLLDIANLQDSGRMLDLNETPLLFDPPWKKTFDDMLAIVQLARVLAQLDTSARPI